MVAGKIKVEKTISFKHKQEVLETRWTELIKRQGVMLQKRIKWFPSQINMMAAWQMKSRKLAFRIDTLFKFYLLVFIATHISTYFSSAPHEAISAYFLHAPLFCARLGIFYLSNCINRNWTRAKSRGLKRLEGRTHRKVKNFLGGGEIPKDTMSQFYN